MAETNQKPDKDEADQRPDIQQAVEARADALARGEGGDPPPLADPGTPAGTGGTGGVVKNQEHDAQ